jgi:serine/threonine protein kinase/tetratricopeptide (TPR) repeat protein
MGQDDDHIGESVEDTSRTLDAGKLFHEIGSHIGDYKLLSVLGEGGFGMVYLAEQEHPIRRQVALKVIKPGMDSKQVIARFETERQALAMLDHPNIAHVFDAGATEAGRPYFAMEYVKGMPITEYCDRHKLGTQERLKLFIPLCQAIQHAHQKGIIHRDIKPSNALVTLQDGKPVPKVIDFGIAKALYQRLTEKTLFTEQGQLIGTPEYMSPEQAEITGLDVDTRTDIYSLGVLLYELLTGCTPFDSQDLRSKGHAEMQRIIREQDPIKPSTKLTTLGGKLADIAAFHSATADQLRKSVRGDLDWIVMKTLEKDRARRYETASALVTDIEHHLNHEPVTASPSSRLYRLRKLVRRNKGVFVAVGAIAAVLVLGLCVSASLYFREVSARRRAILAEQQAQTEASKSRQVADFLKDMFATVKPSVALGRDTTLLREVLEKAATRVGEELGDQPEVETELRRVIGATFGELGDYDRLEAMHREALAIEKRLHGDEHPHIVVSLYGLVTALSDEGKLEEAESLAREALTMQRKLLGDEDPEISKALNSLAIVLWRQGKLAEAETLYREALAAERKLPSREHPYAARSLNNLALVLWKQGKLQDAETTFRETLAMAKKLYGQEHPDIARAMNNLAAVLYELDKPEEAEAMYREGLAMQKKLLGQEHPEIAKSLNNLAAVLKRRGKLGEAEAMQREALAMETRLLGREHPDVPGFLTNLAGMLKAQNKLAEAEQMHREALAIRKALFGPENPDVAQSLNSLASVLSKQNKPTEAEPLAREALAIRRKLLGNKHLNVARSLDTLAGILKEQGKLAEAEAMQREAQAIRAEQPQTQPAP